MYNINNKMAINKRIINKQSTSSGPHMTMGYDPPVPLYTAGYIANQRVVYTG